MTLLGSLLDGDLPVVSALLPFGTRRDPEPLAQATDAIVAAETDQVQSGDPGQMDSMVGELTGDLEALDLGVDGTLTALDDLGRNGDPGHALVHLPERFG